MAEHSKYQQKVIRNYYKNQDAITVQKLAELVTNLYLAEGKKADRLWKQADTYLERLEVGPKRREHLLERKDPALLAKVVEEMFGRK
ncbi:Hypothetical protein PBC10988_37820 [Planctomycetales bacterium 10988]|nr:Hypothetical protein PBC10988_37820 [Planctomycetales bacterium 10988]